MVTVREFGVTKDGRTVSCYRIPAGAACLEVLDYGCTVHRLEVPDRDGKMTDVCLGYDTVGEYEANDGYLGAVIGRHGNRICRGRFTLNGTAYRLNCNDGENHLHGGAKGFDKYIWQAEILEDGVLFSRCSEDGEEGYPGNLHVQVEYRFTRDYQWILEYRAESDRDTVINMTNHCYFNLNGSGSGDVKGHMLRLNAGAFTENGPGCLPNGRILPVEHTVFDFRGGKMLGRDLELDEEQLRVVGGYDHNFVLEQTAAADKELPEEAGALWSGKSGICMKIYTTQPGIQVYTANVLTDRPGKDGAQYHPHDGVCLETQYFPNSMECPEFPSIVLKKGEKYRQATIYEFGVTGAI